jgi:hypothetical protein
MYYNLYFSHVKKKQISNLLIKRTKSNYFITVSDDYTKKCFFKISGGYAYKIGAFINKKKANNKKLKFKTTLNIKKKRKDFKKTSYFALEYILSKTFLNILQKNYNYINFFINGYFKSYLFNTIYFF